MEIRVLIEVNRIGMLLLNQEITHLVPLNRLQTFELSGFQFLKRCFELSLADEIAMKCM
jgi:hypothetical protein